MICTAIGAIWGSGAGGKHILLSTEDVDYGRVPSTYELANSGELNTRDLQRAGGKVGGPLPD
jgi:hypothetical protein